MNTPARGPLCVTVKPGSTASAHAAPSAIASGSATAVSMASTPADTFSSAGGARPSVSDMRAPPERDALLSPLKISVVLPTYWRPAMLDHYLGALLAQDFAPDAYEIVVCDDGPDEATRVAVAARATQAAARGLAVRYLPIAATQGPAGARNQGWRAAHGRVVAFTDDDTIPARGWLTAGWLALARGDAAASGRVELLLPPRPTDYERDASGLSRAKFVTANAFVRKSVLLQVDGFDERFTAAWREDSDLQFAILAVGGTIRRAEDAVVLHPVRPARWGVSLSQKKKSEFDALLYKKHRALYLSRISRSPPWHYYRILLALALALFGLWSGQRALGTGALLAWAALTGRFYWRRMRHTAHTPLHILEMVWTSITIPPLSIYWRLVGAFKFRVLFL